MFDTKIDMRQLSSMIPSRYSRGLCAVRWWSCCAMACSSCVRDIPLAMTRPPRTRICTWSKIRPISTLLATSGEAATSWPIAAAMGSRMMPVGTAMMGMSIAVQKKGIASVTHSVTVSTNSAKQWWAGAWPANTGIGAQRATT